VVIDVPRADASGMGKVRPPGRSQGYNSPLCRCSYSNILYSNCRLQSAINSTTYVCMYLSSCILINENPHLRYLESTLHQALLFTKCMYGSFTSRVLACYRRRQYIHTMEILDTCSYKFITHIQGIKAPAQYPLERCGKM
jgi:hypothetical protein